MMSHMIINPRVLTDILLNAARDNAGKGHCEIAAGLFEQALRKLEDSFGQESLELAPVLTELGDCYETLGRGTHAHRCRSRLSTILLKATE